MVPARYLKHTRGGGGLFPGKLIGRACHIRNGEVIPHLLGDNDLPWMRVLIDEFHRFAGRPRRELDNRLREPLPCDSPPGKRDMAIHTLSRICRDRECSPVKPRRARMILFEVGAKYPGCPGIALSEAARTLNIEPSLLRDSLFADLPGERKLISPPEDLSPGELVLRTNLSLAQSLLFRASSVRIGILGNARTIVRHARLRGLICTVRAAARNEECKPDISGPFALFRRTLVYGRSLSELIPLLIWCNHFRLSAACVIREHTATLRLQNGDPIFPSREPKRFDSRLEKRFAREFGKVAPDWDLVREPEPVKALGTLIFPDFALWRRERPEERWLLEIIGFWTPDYVENKLARLKAAQLTNLILCIDEERNCSDEELPENALVVRYRRKIDVEKVLRIVSNDMERLLKKPNPQGQSR